MNFLKGKKGHKKEKWKDRTDRKYIIIIIKYEINSRNKFK